jgi:hypothetical protein
LPNNPLLPQQTPSDTTTTTTTTTSMTFGVVDDSSWNAMSFADIDEAIERQAVRFVGKQRRT